MFAELLQHMVEERQSGLSVRISRFIEIDSDSDIGLAGLLVAAVVPGILAVVFYILSVSLTVRLRPALAPAPPVSHARPRANQWAASRGASPGPESR